MPTKQNRRSCSSLNHAGIASETGAGYQLLTTSLPIRSMAAGLPLACLAACIAEADVAAGRATAYNLGDAEIVQIRPESEDAPTYFASYSPGRQGRPQHPPECPLCIEQVHGSGQNFAEIHLAGHDLRLLANPFSYMPLCITWASSQHRPQAAGLADDSDSWQPAFVLMLTLCTQLRDHVVGFNALAGNSLDHFHLVSHRPVRALGPYAMQQSAARLSSAERKSVTQIGARHEYPTELWRIGIEDIPAAAEAAAALVERWLAVGGASATVNCAAVCEDGHAVLYIFPRCALLRAQGWRSPAFMEFSGVFIASDSQQMESIRSGQFDHAYFSRVLASLHPPLLQRGEAFKSWMRDGRQMPREAHGINEQNRTGALRVPERG